MTRKKTRARAKARKTPKVQQPAPPEKQIGLFVTEELGHAIEACRDRVQRIAAECKARNTRFRDLEFDVQLDSARCLSGLTESASTGKDVRRVTELFDNPHFFPAGGAANSNAIKQGALGDCWFLSALATVSCIPGLIEKICVARDEQVGIYGFIFYGDKGWSSVIVDDMLYTQIPKFEELDRESKAVYHEDKQKYENIARKNGASLLFAKSGSQEETWVALIEKAYAKFYGNYAHLEGGWTREAIEDLTGGVAAEFITKDILDVDRFWKEELLQANKDRLFACSFDSLATPSDELFGDSPTVQGLYGNHAYAILRAVECLGKRFVVVRNPWGKSEWTGPWSDGSKEWTPEWIRILPQLGHTFGDDGQFIMEYDDFLRSFTSIEKTYLFDDSWIVSSQWLNVQPKGQPAAWSYGDLSFIITMPARSKVILVLSKLNTRAFRSIRTTINTMVDLAIVKKGTKVPIMTAAETLPLHCRSISVELELEEGEYFIYVRLDQSSIVQAGTFDNLTMVRVAMKDSLVARTLQDVIEADFADTTKDATESQEKKETPTLHEVFATKPEEEDGTECEEPPKNAENDKLPSAPASAVERAVQISIDPSPQDKMIGKTEVTKEESNSVNTFQSKLFAIILLGGLNMLAFFGLALIWALKSPSSKDDSSNADDADDANSHSDNESMSSADDYPPSPIYAFPLLQPPIPGPFSSLHSPLTKNGVTQWQDLLKEDSNNIILGLRVYTQTKDPAKIVHRLKKALD
ncbi:hypothetical protein EST38_g1919 [Candolleomyces aberdarensis]|uniref:Calpain catalytic domain-containing protein n=1 Tax=Candolleomyces aberdarensis TaxID=2316362 RepID=A0A4Q2DUY6_9AGAR|nr:hypothetical protein EST38_g1919 [Candolleomyces aberdarensis]